jgi:hypothetical protein
MASRQFTRRDWLFQSAMLGVTGWLTPGAVRVTGARPSAGEHHIYFGDLHNHNAVGYAQGSLERTFQIARNHLDFFAFTPHGWWHDIGHYENHIERKWLDGFEVVQKRWPEVLEQVRKYDQPGVFVPIAGFEWHSSAFGDYHVLFPGLEAKYARHNELRQLQQFAREEGALLIPHHPANRLGHRGANFQFRDPALSPVLEIFSEWGNAEHDRAPSPYIRHTQGGRWTQNTMQYLLSQGHRFGVLASTDDHLGYPGAYREGLAAVLAPELTRAAIFDAIRHRRTYAVSGDRIQLAFRLNGQIMGSELPYVRQRRIEVAVTGWDQIDRVELLKNNRVIQRHFPMDRPPSVDCWSRPVLARFEYGWGPWAALGMERVCDWDVHITLEGGELTAIQPCFQAGPLDEQRRDRMIAVRGRSLHLRSFTALRQQFEDSPTKAVVLKVRGGAETRINVKLRAPKEVSLSRTFRQQAESSEMLFTGPFPNESAMLHRLVLADHYQADCSWEDEDAGGTGNWYYVRVVQANGQLAWSSPIWVAGQQKARGSS